MSNEPTASDAESTGETNAELDPETTTDLQPESTEPDPESTEPDPETATGAPPDADELDAATQRRVVRERYSDIANSSTSCCGDGAASTSSSPSPSTSVSTASDTACCGGDASSTTSTGADGPDEPDWPDGADDKSRMVGYSDADLEDVASGANLGLGCGNPTAIASLETGDTVLDLGSGGGFDCFLAAREVGADGHVIGVDMTPEMVETARENVVKNDASNVEFRLGEIEHLPVRDGSVDVIISNCVVNLSPDKPQVFREAFRVLRPGGRLAIADVVQTAPFPADIELDPASVAGCVAGASRIADLEGMLASAGFEDVSIEPKAESEAFIRHWDADRDVSDYVVSATIEARKPDR